MLAGSAGHETEHHVTTLGDLLNFPHWNLILAASMDVAARPHLPSWVEIKTADFLLGGGWRQSNTIYVVCLTSNCHPA